MTMDSDSWAHHFRRMSKGKLKRNRKGHFIVEKVQPTKHDESLKPSLAQEAETEKPPIIELVTPVAQAVKMAKSRVKSNRQELHEFQSKRKMSRLHGPPGYRD